MEFSELLGLIGERAGVFRATVAGAPDLDAEVPTCPGWTLWDLTEHLGAGRRKWAATVAAGPADAVAPKSAWEVPAPRDRDGLLAWFDESIALHVDALRAAGAHGGTWTWWGDSQSPETAWGVARHQVQEILVHTYDAQLAATGTAEPLPADLAVDGVEEFLFTCVSTDSAWPHDPATVDYVAAEGPAWRITLGPAGARIGVPDATPATATLRGAAADLVLVLYGRKPVDSQEPAGDRKVFDQLIEWDPS